LDNAASENSGNGGERWQKTKLILPLPPQFLCGTLHAAGFFFVNLFAEQIGKIAPGRENNLLGSARDPDSGG